MKNIILFTILFFVGSYACGSYLEVRDRMNALAAKAAQEREAALAMEKEKARMSPAEWEAALARRKEQAAKDALAKRRAEIEEGNRPNIDELCEFAKSAVLTRLRSPATAKFPACYKIEFRTDRTERIAWAIGYVDAQNAFGALLRAKFLVKFKRPSRKISIDGGKTFISVGGPWSIVQVEVE